MLLQRAVEQYRDYLCNVDRARTTIKGYTSELHRFSGYIGMKYNGPVYMEEIVFNDLEDYLISLKQSRLSPDSRNRSIYILRSFYSFCTKKKYCSSNMAEQLELLKATQKERLFITQEDVNKLASQIEQPIIRLIVLTLYYTGMRVSECVNLQFNDVNLDNSVILIKNTKTKVDRTIPVHHDLKPLLEDYAGNWRRGRFCPCFFTSNSTSRVSPDHINRVLGDACRKLGWDKKVTCHILRHSFASSLVARNINIVNIQKLLGHKSLSTTSVYTHANLADLHDAVNSI